ncbi:MAG: hypothetical protein GX929_08875, partial [Clostridiales bacterium]|nr:hypothetical protein [Clostridiales bacterium]
VASFDAGAVNVPGYDRPLDPSLFIVNTKPLTHIALTADMGITVALDTTLDEELIAEGTCRELLRQCQVLRREFGFRVEQHIRMSLTTADKTVAKVLEQYRDTLARETLADELYLESRGYPNTKTVTAGNADVNVEMEVIA